jgi:hypothetical protein
LSRFSGRNAEADLSSPEPRNLEQPTVKKRKGWSLPPFVRD